MRGLDVLGAHVVGDGSSLDWIGPLTQGTGEIIRRGVEYGLSQQQQQQSAASEAQRLQAAISADSAAVDAVTAALFDLSQIASAADPARKVAAQAQADADKQAADFAESTQDQAGAALTTDASRASRLTAAQKLVSAAVADLQTHPTDPWKKAHVAAARKTATKAAAAQIAATPLAQQGDVKKRQAEDQARLDAAASGGGTFDFFSKPVAGPVKVWHGLALGGLGLAGWWWKPWRLLGRR